MTMGKKKSETQKTRRVTKSRTNTEELEQNLDKVAKPVKESPPRRPKKG